MDSSSYDNLNEPTTLFSHSPNSNAWTSRSSARISQAMDVVVVVPSPSGRLNRSGKKSVVSCSEFVLRVVEGGCVPFGSSCCNLHRSSSPPSSLLSSSSSSSSLSPSLPLVDVEINHCKIDDLQMRVEVDGYARFLHGSGSGSSSCGDGRMRNLPREEVLTRLTSSVVVRSSSTDGADNDDDNVLLRFGANLLRYTVASGDGGEGSPILLGQAKLYLWSCRDSVVVTDIDGTITKTDVRGFIDSAYSRTIRHVHAGVCRGFHEVLGTADRCRDEGTMKMAGTSTDDGRRTRLLYLTARPLSVLRHTRRLLRDLRQVDGDGVLPALNSSFHRLPDGPILCVKGHYGDVIRMELSKTTDAFKCDTLRREIVDTFLSAGRNPNENVFLAGFGNKITDARAYVMAGMHPDDVYIINPESKMVCLSSVLMPVREGQTESIYDNNTINPGGSTKLPSVTNLFLASSLTTKDLFQRRQRRGCRSNPLATFPAVTYNSYDSDKFQSDFKEKIREKHASEV